MRLPEDAGQRESADDEPDQHDTQGNERDGPNVARHRPQQDERPDDAERADREQRPQKEVQVGQLAESMSSSAGLGSVTSDEAPPPTARGAAKAATAQPMAVDNQVQGLVSQDT